MKRILFIIGTRPEAIKCAPLIKALELHKKFNPIVVLTSQHQHMLTPIINFFKLKIDKVINLNRTSDSLSELTIKLLPELEKVIIDSNPDYILVQGDTSSAFLGALSGFYQKRPIIHLEAGLRSFNKYLPFPEEMNRKLISNLADIHLVPTEKNKEVLATENIQEHVFKVGNTVIDALLNGLKIIQKCPDQFENYFQNKQININQKSILITLHRRETIGKELIEACEAILELSKQYPKIQWIFPVHLNPKINEPVKEILGNQENIKLLPPLDYPYFIYLLSKSFLILTDSGGIQEEAPSINVPVLILRDVTERNEILETGAGKLIGTNRKKVIMEISSLIDDAKAYKKMLNTQNPYGDGKASQKIIKLFETFL